MNVAALVEYDGTRFAGFQRQSADKGPTVQGEIEHALLRLTGEAIRVVAAGRTDSGVHATGQVIHFVAGRQFESDVWRRALNALLPREIAIRAACEVDERFHARRSALSRSYRYRILCDPVRSPLRERFVWQVDCPLDVEAMNAAAASLIGEHDFGAFGSSPQDRPREGFRGHTVRDVRVARCGWSERWPDEIDWEFTANAFLSGMVRRLVGTLALVGEGRLSVSDFTRILDAREKAHPGAAAPSRGLYLEHVAYPAGMVTW